MQNFSWNLFSATGNIDAYLLYKEFERMSAWGEDDPELSDNSAEIKGTKD